MKLLGIDYGRAKIGLAVAEGSLASPLRVIRVSGFKDALREVREVLEVQKVQMVVVGISEGAMGEEQERFVFELKSCVDIPVETFDEGLTTQDAQFMAREAGLKQKKRREMEDAYAACVMLQSYLDCSSER